MASGVANVLEFSGSETKFCHKSGGGMAEKLYKAYVKTLDHPHVLEMIVSAPDEEAATRKALSHVKEANPEKGRSLAESQKNSVVLAVKAAGKNGCIVINKLPLVIFEEISKTAAKKGA
ncbi:hypothetical protein [Burkholderia ubonensis]|uniref:hypothetical protein n=1 Tax=Burkholderia ubonensis TaxID=101571 RepID=UPI000B111B66|nr:hypothetical protein [Burkholderia ubonensis]